MTRILNQQTALTKKIKKSKLDLEFAISTDPLKICPVITQKTKKYRTDRHRDCASCSQAEVICR